jgi:hypothetical protein
VSTQPPPNPSEVHPDAGPLRDAVQLRLLPGRAGRTDWVLDERTRRTGRAGVAQAREILRQARPPRPRDELSKAS